MKEIFNNAIWRFFSTFWGMFYLVVVCINFLSDNIYEHILGPLGTVYVAALAIFVGSKEFDRWHERHPGKRRGEIFVIIFTTIIFLMFVTSFIKGEIYKVSSDVSAAYIAVLSVFVISQKSKDLHEEKKREEKK